MRDLTWTCHACAEERPDDQIGVVTVHGDLGGVPFDINQRYCRDRVECYRKAHEQALAIREKLSSG